MPLFTLMMTIATITIGGVVLWTQPTRQTNQIFSLLWFTLGVWFGLVHFSMRANGAVPTESSTQLAWLRANAAVAAFFPSLIWWLKEAIVADAGKKSSFRHSLQYFAVSVLLIPLCLSHSFIQPSVTGTIPLRGTAYFIYIVILLILLLGVIADIYIQARKRTGIRRLELQFLALTMGAVCLLGTACVGVGNYLQNGAIRDASLFVFVCGYALTAWAITAHRIFDAKQVIVSLCHRLVLAIVLSIGIFSLAQLLEQLTAPAPALFLSVAISSLTTFWIDRKSQEWLRLGDRHIETSMRGGVIELTRTEADPDKLLAAFERMIRERFLTRRALFLFDHGFSHGSGTVEFMKDRPAHAALCKLGWSTPESLHRRRSTSERGDLQEFMAEHSIAAIVAIPRGSSNPSMLVALGPKETEWPFTFPEVERLQNIAELMDNILTRSRLTTQEAMKAKAEHLAMMSRGLAHDLKNLLTPVSSFLIHTEGRFPADSDEAEVHTAAQRSIRIMGDYVSEARFFADRLAPRLEPCSLRSICESARGIMAARATSRDVALHVYIERDQTITADSVLIQRLLGNLLANAIDASAAGTKVTLSVSFPPSGEHVLIEVRDQGCGIAPENLSRIFEPYFTTKEFGTDVRGFGLGLTICQKIAALHEGTISVRSEPGHGTTFAINLPVAPPPTRAAVAPAKHIERKQSGYLTGPAAGSTP